MTGLRAWGVALLAGSLVGGSVSAVMMDIAWQHNPQTVFHETGQVHWVPWLTVGASWLAVVGSLVLLVVRWFIWLDAWMRTVDDRESAG